LTPRYKPADSLADWVVRRRKVLLWLRQASLPVYYRGVKHDQGLTVSVVLREIMRTKESKSAQMSQKNCGWINANALEVRWLRVGEIKRRLKVANG